MLHPLVCPGAPRLMRRAIWCVAALSGLTGLPAHAEKADQFKPLNFVADSARSDDAQQVNVLTGNVDLTKGTMILRAARVEVRQNADGTQFAVATGGNGGRSYFRQKREGMDEFIEGESERIEYDGQADTVRFIGKAEMRRLRGAAVSDEVAGQTIVYNNAADVFQVVGGPSSAAPGGRVRGMLSPRTPAGGAR
ncbi:lipopolysaccharide transport periplasmic protein LptA [Aquabacterium sp.]|uniref:lipopolysaccharide transport periplasmic protein LptA n=1 Tax=Aquabacterium sp. TaxID=1872578 RepID=UPI0035B1A635